MSIKSIISDPDLDAEAVGIPLAAAAEVEVADAAVVGVTGQTVELGVLGAGIEGEERVADGTASQGGVGTRVENEEEGEQQPRRPVESLHGKPPGIKCDKTPTRNWRRGREPSRL